MNSKTLKSVLMLTLIFVLMLALVPMAQASSPTFDWHTFFGDTGHDYANASTVDGGGNLYAAGIAGSGWTGPGGESPLHAYSGGNDISVLKLGSDGAYQWHTFYGGGDDRAYGIARDGSGNLYVAGFSTATWNGPSGESPLNAYSGEADLFVLKLDSNGAYQWHTFYGSGPTYFQNDSARSIAVDGSDLYVTGSSDRNWTGPSGESPLHAHSGGGTFDTSDLVVLKLDSNGTYQWHTFYGGGNIDGGNGVVAGGGGVYVTGESHASWNGPSGESPLNAYVSQTDIAVLKLDSNGAYQWHTFYGSSAGEEYAKSIAADGSGGLYVTGRSYGDWNGPSGESPLNAHNGSGDIAVFKLNTDGAYQWHTFYGSSTWEIGYGAAVDGNGDLYLAGFSGDAWTGPGGESPLHAYNANGDITVLKVNTDGAYQWHTFYGGSQSDSALSIALGGSDLYVSGHSFATWDGDGGASPLHDHTGDGLLDMVMLKFAGPAALTAVPPAVEIYPGDVFDVDLDVTGAVDLYGLQALCTVDPTILETQSGAFGDLLDPANRLIGANTPNAGAGTWFGGASLQAPATPVTGDGLFATLTYEALIPGDSDVVCDPLASDIDGFELAISSLNSSVTVLPYGAISGTVQYQGRLDHSSINVWATGIVSATDVTDAAGAFDLTLLRNGSYDVTADVALYLPSCTNVPVVAGQTTVLSPTILVGGDTNDDDQISIGDATLVGANFGMDIPPGAANADINNDSRVNVQDLAIIGGNFGLTGCQSW